MTRQLFTVGEVRDVVGAFTAPPALDYETNGQQVHHHASRIVGVTLAGPMAPAGPVEVFYVPVAHQNGRNAEAGVFTPLAEYLDVHPVVPFYLNTEYQWTLHKLKVRLKIVGDAYYAARLLQLDAKGLKDLAATVLKRENVITLADLLPAGIIDFSLLDAQDPRVNQYVYDDGLNAYELEQTLRAEVMRLGMQGVYELELLAAAVLVEQELTGYLMKPSVLADILSREQQRVEKLSSEIFAELGCKPFTINAYVQLGKALKAKGYTSPLQTETGAESWSVDALKLMPPSPLLTKIIDWKKTFSVVNGLARAPILPASDGRVHPQWLPMGYSGNPRMQSERPVLTNLPRAARAAFPAAPGQRWYMARWLQPEIRALAMESGDRNMIDLLNTAYDFYTTVGATIRGAAPGEGVEQDREFAKALLYAYIDYCGDPALCAKRLNLTLEITTRALHDLYRLFPALHTFAGQVATRVNEPGTTPYIVSYMNRRWILQSDERGQFGGPAMRAYTQHSVATFLKIAMTRLMGHVEIQHPALRGFHSLIPVYDTLYYCVDASVPVVQHLSHMTSVFEQPFKEVTMRAEYGVGPTWGDTAVITQEAFAQALADFTASRTPDGWSSRE